MDKKGFSDEAKNKIGGKSKSFSKYLTNAEFSFPLAKSPQCIVCMYIFNCSNIYEKFRTSFIFTQCTVW